MSIEPVAEMDDDEASRSWLLLEKGSEHSSGRLRPVRIRSEICRTPRSLGVRSLPGRGAVATGLRKKPVGWRPPGLAADQGAELPVEFENLQAGRDGRRPGKIRGAGNLRLADEPRTEASSAVEGPRNVAGIAR